MRVGWLGMGQVGRPMALRALAEGHVVTGYTRRPDDYADLCAAGGAVTTVLADAVADAAVVCVNLFSEAQVFEVLLDGGALAAMEPGAILAIHSTIGAAAIETLARARGDVRVIDAAFSGTARDARERHIALMVGGDPTTLRDAEPVLSSYADFIAHVGPLGSGMTLKLLNNMLFGAQLLLAHDALVAAAARGIAPDDAVKVLVRCSGASYATRLFEGADPDAVLSGVRRYVEKDVAVAHAMLAGQDIGGLAAATERFVRPVP